MTEICVHAEKKDGGVASNLIRLLEGSPKGSPEGGQRREREVEEGGKEQVKVRVKKRRKMSSGVVGFR